ncbi:MAG: hypothetical protein GXO31_02935 [Epsilonproteobacteria bacterium]|nr:hypothetical protein [Campylobacterota bacterium]
MKKILYSLFILGLFAAIGYYFYSNESYRKSIEAKYYYMKGDYQKAYELSREAFDLDPYNKMAFTVMTQSKISSKFQRYIEDGNKFLKKIEEISNKPKITEADKIRIKMMTETMIERFKTLTPTALTDKKLSNEAYKVYRRFKKIHEELFRE